MGVLSYLREQARISVGAGDETRSLPRPENQLPLVGGYTYVDRTLITPAAALAIGDVWACIRCLADAASSLPLHAYRRTDRGRERVTSGRLADLLEHPSPGTTQADLVSSLMAHLLLHGNAYLAKYRDQGEVRQLALLDPERVRPELAGGQVRYRYDPPSGPQQMLTTSDVVHVRGLSVDGLNGLSAVQQAGRVLGLSDELVKHAVSFFERGGGLPTAVFKMPPDASTASQEPATESLRNKMIERGVLVIEGEGDYQPITLRLDDAQFADQRRLSAQETARVFRIPPHMIGAPSADSMTYSNVEQESIEFVRYSLAPWLRRIELAVSGDRDLTFDRQYVRFELDGLLRADAKTRAEIYRLGLDPVQGWMSREEVRRLEDLEPEPEPTIQQQLAAAVNGAMQEASTNGN